MGKKKRHKSKLEIFTKEFGGKWSVYSDNVWLCNDSRFIYKKEHFYVIVENGKSKEFLIENNTVI